LPIKSFAVVDAYDNDGVGDQPVIGVTEKKILWKSG
jgi:hypothetical protein